MAGEVTGSVPEVPRFPVLYWPIKLFVAEPLVNAVFRPWVRGLENVPTDGPAILASNHLSAADTVLLPTVVSRRVTFIAKADLFRGKGVRGALTKGLLHGIGQLPVDRSGGRASSAAIDNAVRVLGEGELFGIYPEGTRSRDGKLARGKTGVAWLALTADCPVVPVAVHGTDQVQPIGARYPRPHKVTITFGEPITFPEQRGLAGNGRARRVVTDRVMEGIAELSGQEKSGW